MLISASDGPYIPVHGACGSSSVCSHTGEPDPLNPFLPPVYTERQWMGHDPVSDVARLEKYPARVLERERVAT